MKPVLIVENDQLLAGAGWLTRVLDRRGLPYRLVDATAGGLDGVRADDLAGMIMLGGRAHAWQEDEAPFLHAERLLTQQCVAGDVPVLGCCLGGQVLARALGGTVRPAAAGEYGWLDIAPTADGARDPLFRLAATADEVYLWHDDEFTVPAGAVHLSTSAATPVQAFRYGRAWGLQFHPECDLQLYDSWHGNFPDACDQVGLDPRAMRQTAARRERQDDLFAVRLIDAFASVVLA
jgi:GMP synthase-like glutamine amidotransferase